jgi:predicted MFS family arabinose efflux permease
MRIAGQQSRSATGILNTGGNIAGGIGAMLVPAIAGAFGWTTAVATGAVCSLLGAALGSASVPMSPSRVEPLACPGL